MLKIQIGRVDRRARESAEHAIEVGGNETARRKQALFGESEKSHVISKKMEDVRRK
jgi:hypothetical protein